MQHRATWWPNECNMLDSTMLDGVASTCWIRLAGPLVVCWDFLDLELGNSQLQDEPPNAFRIV